MPQPYCHHILATGALCQAAPLRNRDYCRFHLDQIGRRMRAARARAQHLPARLKLPLLEDPFAVQLAIMQVADAIVHNEIDVPRGRLLMSLLRLAGSNLKKMRDWEHEPLFVTHEGEEEYLEWPSFEQEHDLPQDLDLSLDPEVAFPVPSVPLNPTEGLNGAPEPDEALRARIRRALGEANESVPPVTADTVELMDIYEREGQEAADKFSQQLVRNDRRRERRRQRAHYEELARHRNIQMAARQMFEEQVAAGVLKPGMTEKEAWEALTGKKTEADRKPPQSETLIEELKASRARA